MSRARAPTRREEAAVIETVVYADLFDYPLTLAQLRTALVGCRTDEATLAQWLVASSRLSRLLLCRDGFVVRRGRVHLVEVRKTREACSLALIERNRPALRSLVATPWVRMVALSGSVAHLNATDDADLDLFVIAAPGRAWLVTLTALVAARLGGWRRTLCLNYVISERSLAIEPADLFTANQVIHLRPVVGGDVFHRFVDANPFVAGLYPNFVPIESLAVVQVSPWTGTIRRLAELVGDWSIAPLLERACRALYGWHLRRRSTRWWSADQVRLEPECLKLHTRSHRREIANRLEAALKEIARAEPECEERRAKGIEEISAGRAAGA